jgi:signal transduction histidine kinase
MPFVTLGGAALLVSIGLAGLAVIRQAERRHIWVGMAKETAHQLGTPLSSLMGWAELLRGRLDDAAPGDEVRVPAEELKSTLDEMERDIDRLAKVAQRFSHVGSETQLNLQDVTPVVRDVVQYMRKRAPQTSGEVRIEERYQPTPELRLNAERMAWALENLISNALSALDKRPGLIEVSVTPRPEQKAVEVTVTDNGRGMTPREQRHAFDPGYTTKRRGWGLGLALARRVVQDHHGGRIFVRQSAPGAGTTMVISLPA